MNDTTHALSDEVWLRTVVLIYLVRKAWANDQVALVPDFMSALDYKELLDSAEPEMTKQVDEAYAACGSWEVLVERYNEQHSDGQIDWKYNA